MTDMIAVAVVDLKAGAALDWAVSEAAGRTTWINLNGSVGSSINGGNVFKLWSPSSHWGCGGSLLFDMITGVNRWNDGWLASADMRDESGFFLRTLESSGSTALEAICKAIVSAKFGDAVTVPKALLGARS